eukprot:30164-Eustigmatos_ZCMA.PRE.1
MHQLPCTWTSHAAGAALGMTEARCRIPVDESDRLSRASVLSVCVGRQFSARFESCPVGPAAGRGRFGSGTV